jgi:hypothetical protein
MLTRDTAAERWGGPVLPNQKARAEADPLEGYLKRHPYAEEMQLTLTVPAAAEGLLRVNAVEESKLTGKERIDIFDVLRTGKEAIKATVADSVVDKAYEVTLPADAELTYVDLILLAHRQNEAAIDKAVAEHMKQYSRGTRRNVGRTSPLLLAAVLKAEAPGGERSEYQRALFNRLRQMWLADFWMF